MSAMGFAILLQILPRVIQPDLTLFQKPVEFISRLETEDALELRGRQLAFAIRLECDGLERCSREVRTRSSQSGREFVRKIEADLHGASIATRANDLSRGRGWQLSVDERAQSCAPHDRVIALTRGKLENRCDVVGLEIRIISEDLLACGAGGEQVQHVLHTDAQAANARATAAHIRSHRDSFYRAHIPLRGWRHRLELSAQDTAGIHFEPSTLAVARFAGGGDV